jgi:glucokinase
MKLGKEQPMILVFDVGATHTRIALSNDGKTLEETLRIDTHNSEAGFESFVGAVGRVASGRRLEAVGGAIAGQIDRATGDLVLADNLTRWNGLPLKRELEEAAGCKAYLGNDVVMGGLGEAQLGAAGRTGVAAYFTVSTGVNAVRLVEGWVDESISGYNVGHLLLPDADGRLVSLETLTGGKAFERRTNESPRAVRDGRSWRAEEHHLARGIFNTALLWTPDRIVFGGSMMRDIDLEAVDRELGVLPDVLPVRPQLLRATLGDTAGMLGAMAWARRKMG